MIRYTTPTITLEVEGIDLTDNEDVYVSFEQGSRELTKSGNDLNISAETQGQTTISTIVVVLTQEETASFVEARNVAVQVNYINASGVRDATGIVSVGVGRNLLDEVIEYGN